MLRPPLEEFLTGELNDYIRSELLTEIEELGSNRRYFEYNIFNVLLDGEASTATVEDELDIERLSTVSLAEFQLLLRTAEGQYPTWPNH